MTFQHNKFEDSPVMRSLTKIAHEKGWIKDVPVVKTAAPKLDLNPTNDLLENLLKLSNGLRHSGFDKQADEIESKFVVYKQAQSLYNTHNESGEDLINSAHPKGSHKLVDVDSKEAVFEDILDQHMKSVDMVEKKPTGKLASSRDIVNAVKIVLAQAPTSGPDYSKYSTDKLEQFINNNVNQVIEIIANVAVTAKSEMSAFIDFTMIQNRIIEASKDPKLDNLQEMVSQINAMETRLQPGSWITLGLGGITKDSWFEVKKDLDHAIRLLNAAIRARTTILNKGTATDSPSESDPGASDTTTEPTAKPVSSATSQLIQNFTDAIKAANLYKARISAKGLTNATELNNWLDTSPIKYGQQWLNEFSKNENNTDPVILAAYTAKYNTLKSKLDAFEQKWAV
jgi:hypothetical protein